MPAGAGPGRGAPRAEAPEEAPKGEKVVPIPEGSSFFLLGPSNP